MVHFITLYSFLIRKKKNDYIENCLTINNWKQGISEDKYNGVGYYKNDKPHGQSYRWYVNGQLGIKCYYKNGKRHGKYYRWDEQGNLIENSAYKYGIEIENYMILKIYIISLIILMVFAVINLLY